MIRKYIKKIFLGTSWGEETLTSYSVLAKQREDALKIWNNEHSNDIGIERVFRLFIMFAQYLFPSLYIRHWFARSNALMRHIAIELYVIAKIIYPFCVLYFARKGGDLWMVILSSYLTFETLLYVSSLIFVEEKGHKTYSHRRAFILICLNYVEIALTFSVLHRYFQTLKGLTTGTFDYIYFSFVTSATVGFGDFHPTSHLGKGLAIIQSLVFIIFVVLFLNFFGSKIHIPHNKKKKNKLPSTSHNSVQ